MAQHHLKQVVVPDDKLMLAAYTLLEAHNLIPDSVHSSPSEL